MNLANTHCIQQNTPLLEIEGKPIGPTSDCYVIAEIGHNHQGSVEQAMQMMAKAHECGADAVKLQKRDNVSLYTTDFYNRPYESENSFGPTYGMHREALEFGEDEYRTLKQYAHELGDHLLRHGVRLQERRSPGRAGHARVQDRIRGRRQHAAAALRGRNRQADPVLDRVRDARGRPPSATTPWRR